MLQTQAGRFNWNFVIIGRQGSYSSWKVLEFDFQVFQAWKLLEKDLSPGKLLEFL
jgi:hypothetical protein